MFMVRKFFRDGHEWIDKKFGLSYIVSTSARHCSSSYASKITPDLEVLENCMSRRMIMVESPQYWPHLVYSIGETAFQSH